MVDAGAIPLKLGIAVCSANAPRQLPTAHAVEAGEAGPSGVSQIPRWESDATSHSTSVNPVTVSHDRTRPLSKNPGHCLDASIIHFLPQHFLYFFLLPHAHKSFAFCFFSWVDFAGPIIPLKQPFSAMALKAWSSSLTDIGFRRAFAWSNFLFVLNSS